MKKLLRLSSLLVTAVLLAFSSQKSYATHMQGGDMTYACIAPNTFVVTMKLYSDCSGVTPPSSASLNAKSTGCNPGRNIPMTKIGATRIGDPYCPSIPKTCASNQLVNYQEVVFKATVTFSATEAQCADWIFSWSECCRPSTANLNGQGTLYLEAYVKLFTPNLPGATPTNIVHNNSSPEFNNLNIPIPFVCYNQEVRYSMNALEFDGDSVSYELDSSMESATLPATYNPIGSGPNGTIINPAPQPPFNTIPPGQPGSNPQIAIFGGGVTTNYSPTYPLSSYNVTWTQGQQVVFAQPYFFLDPQTGEIAFRPSEYYPNTASNLGKNKYAVVVKIKEWRKINGVMVNVGYIRRDIMFIIEDCGGNTPPVTDPRPVPPIFGTVIGDTVYKVQTCTSTRITVDFKDQNANDSVTVFFNPGAGSTLPNGSFQVFDNGTSKTRAVINITPLPSDIGRVFLIPVRLEDNSCPLKGVSNEVIKIEVISNNRVDILDTVQTICLGESLPITANLMRPDSILGDTASYRYQWEAAPGLNPADQKKKNIVVTPTQDTWYRVTVRNASLNGCFDYDSILVKVNPIPVINDIKVAYGPNKENKQHIVYGRSAQINVNLSKVDTGFTYSWSPGRDLSDSTVMNPIASPLKTTKYTLTVKSADGQCKATKSVDVIVGPFFLPNVITPNGDKLNDVFEYVGIQPNTSLKIFSRWGVLIKEYSSYDNSFGGEGVSDGTYYYIMQEPNGGKSYKGWFEIVRD
ncbi:gliding motility-associated C-terminal domain-containing protein [Adhaeribacter sp. BT258]|uniref:Gliding motility-associated C-terminal domain-containing protein n=1 Tax=Adhaeribacter terrigena TaxID=2793070 RepID=A0ABS1C3Q6_9BACT|nr:gliding motility-associated C-terminal domain-containing protein [Adhaeribacter terrigena]MBK0403980.1 gliding motility-associated C-terminal domain-containing protein [Adhaeribacter terrigena]